MAQQSISKVLYFSNKTIIFNKQFFRHFSLITKEAPNLVRETSKLIEEKSNSAVKQSIEDYYKGANVFITGGTGFLGKAIIAKLLRTCDLNSIILLVRPKHGSSPEERLKDMFKNEVFDNIKQQMPETLNKVQIVSGDISEENLGLSPKDQQLFKNSVNVIFHSAATVKLNGPLPETLQLNTFGTQQVLNLAQNTRHLKSFAYISSTYSNCHLPEVKDTIYKPRYDPQAVISFTQSFPAEDVKLLEKRLVGQHTGTYTFSKNLSENIVNSYYGHLPVCIVRPSIVISSWKEPFPGWTENLYGANSLAFGLGTGQLKSFPCKSTVTLDVIPVDIVANATIAVPWHLSQTSRETIPIYNLCSGDISNITIGKFMNMAILNSRRYPPKKLLWYPRHVANNGKYKEIVLRNLVQRPISAFADLTLWLRGKKTVAMKNNKKFEDFSDMVRYIVTHNFSFKSENLSKLIKAVEDSTSRDKFNVNFSRDNGFLWEEFFPVYMKGLWRHILKEDVEKNLKENKKILKRVHLLDVGVKCILCSGMFSILALLFYV